MKKLLVILSCLILSLTLMACIKQNDNSASEEENTIKNTSSENKIDNDENQSKKTLIAYFSATGSTEQVAKYIASETGGMLLKLTPEDPYTDEDLDYNSDSSRVVNEYNNPEQRNIKLEESTISDFDDYDTIFVGYPIWWGTAAWPINDFIKENNFEGKTVIPFCTSASSGIGESAKQLEELSNGGNWLEGMRFSSEASQSEVIEWINGLNLQ